MKKTLLPNLLLSCFLIFSKTLFAADLSLQVIVPQSNAVRGDTLSAIIRLENQGRAPVSEIAVRLTFSDGLTLVFNKPAMGRFDEKTGLWHLSKLEQNSPGSSVMVLVLVEGEGPLAIQAEIENQNENDTDSTPGNGKMGEDDLAFGFITVPIVYCGSDSIKLEATAWPDFTGYQWRRDGAMILGATEQVLKITSPGKYTCSADQTNGSDEASFPVIVRRAAELRAEMMDEHHACAGETLKLRPKIMEGNPPYRYRWKSSDGHDLSKTLKAGEKLNVLVIITDREGCLVEKNTKVVVEKCEH